MPFRRLLLLPWRPLLPWRLQRLFFWLRPLPEQPAPWRPLLLWRLLVPWRLLRTLPEQLPLPWKHLEIFAHGPQLGPRGLSPPRLRQQSFCREWPCLREFPEIPLAGLDPCLAQAPSGRRLIGALEARQALGLGQQALGQQALGTPDALDRLGMSGRLAPLYALVPEVLYALELQVLEVEVLYVLELQVPEVLEPTQQPSMPAAPLGALTDAERSHACPGQRLRELASHAQESSISFVRRPLPRR